MPFPDKLLADDEDIVRHLHPHWLTLSGPVVRLLLIVGGTSFAAALVPAGRHQGTLRLLVLGLAVILLAICVAAPMLRWRTTHYVLTTSRLLVRQGVLVRRGRDVGLSRITDVSFRQSLWERVLNFGTLTVDSAGEGPGLVLRRVQDPDGVAQELHCLISEASDRRGNLAHDGLGYQGVAYPSANQPAYQPSGSVPSVPAGSWRTEPIG